MSMIQFSKPDRDSAKVSMYSRKVLRDIMQASGINQIRITSTARTAADQARIMFENIERYGVSHQKKLYGSYGDKVIDEYSVLKQEAKTEAEIILGMTEKINSLGPRNVSRHTADPEKLNVIDIAPSSIRLPLRAKFEATVKRDPRVSKFLTPPLDPAYHLEIPQPQRR